jgi:hypothetical protein
LVDKENIIVVAKEEKQELKLKQKGNCFTEEDLEAK